MRFCRFCYFNLRFDVFFAGVFLPPERTRLLARLHPHSVHISGILLFNYLILHVFFVLFPFHLLLEFSQASVLHAVQFVLEGPVKHALCNENKACRRKLRRFPNKNISRDQLISFKNVQKAMTRQFAIVFEKCVAGCVICQLMQ
jgi:hypothetical protein